MISATDSAMKIRSDGSNIAALAVVSTDSRGQVLITHYEQRSHPPSTTRHFGTVEEAKPWLALSNSTSTS